jgi:autotransporter-associated beta strand protein
MSRAIITNTVRSGLKSNLAKALLAGASLMALGSQGASALCTASTQIIYDGCATAAAWGLDPAINVTFAGTILHDGLFAANIGGAPGTLRIFSGSTLHDTGAFGGGFFNTGVALTVDAGGFIILDGTDPTGTFVGVFVDTFASLAGAGTLTVTTPGPGFGVLFGNNNASTAFSGTVVMPNLSNFLAKTGTGTFTINGMTMAEGELLDGGAGGGLSHTGGTSNIKAIAIGTGALGNNIMAMTGGTLNIVGTGGVGTPCGSLCPQLRIGDFFGTATLNHSAGSINIGTTGIASSLNVGNQTGNGTYNLSGTGTLNLGVLGDGNSAGLYAIGRQASASASHNGGTTTGLFNQTGGTVNVNAGEFIVGDRDAGGALLVTTNSTLTISGGTFRVQAGANLWLSAFDNLAATDSTTNISGTGVLEIGDGRLVSGYGGGTGAYLFNLGGGAGGTIKVIDSPLVTSVNANLVGLTAAAGIKIDTNGMSADWNGVLFGAGWVVKTGVGTLTLDGTNTYTGGTGFHGGTVEVDDFDDLGAAVAGMSFTGGGILKLMAAGPPALGLLSGRTGGTAMAGAGTIDTNGFSTVYDGAITGSGALTKIGLGTLDLGGANNAHTGALNINAGTLRAFTGNNIGNTSAVTVAAGATLLRSGIAGTETIGSLAGAVGSFVVLTDGGLITGGNGASTAFSGTTSGAGGLTKTGAGTMSTLSLGHLGLTTVSGGNLNVNGTVADSVTIAAGGTFSGNTIISGNLTLSAGGILAPGTSIGTTTVNGLSFIGGGNLLAEVQFNNAGAPVNSGLLQTHDFFDINTTVSNSGASTVTVVAFAPSTVPTATVGNGIQLVRIRDVPDLPGPETATFALTAPVIQGAYQYILRRVNDYAGLDDGYFLQSEIRQELAGVAAALSSGHAMQRACRNNSERVKQQTANKDEVWLAGETGELDATISSDFRTEADYTCGSGGASSTIRWVHGMRLGASIGGGNSSTDLFLDPAQGMAVVDITSLSGEVYATFAEGPFYASAALGYTDMTYKFAGPVNAVNVSASGGGMYWSILAGLGMDLFPGLHASAQIGFDYDGTQCETKCFNLTGLNQVGGITTAEGQLKLEADVMGLNPYAAISYANVIDGSAMASMGLASSTGYDGDEMLTGIIGLNAHLSGSTMVFVEGQFKEAQGSVVADGQAIKAGARFHW